MSKVIGVRMKKKIILLIIPFIFILIGCGESKPKYYTLSFITDCDIVINDEVYLEGDGINTYNLNLVRDGYYFRGWYDEDDSTKEILTYFYINKNMTIHAMWEKD